MHLVNGAAKHAPEVGFDVFTRLCSEDSFLRSYRHGDIGHVSYMLVINHGAYVIDPVADISVYAADLARWKLKGIVLTRLGFDVVMGHAALAEMHSATVYVASPEHAETCPPGLAQVAQNDDPIPLTPGQSGKQLFLQVVRTPSYTEDAACWAVVPKSGGNALILFAGASVLFHGSARLDVATPQQMESLTMEAIIEARAALLHKAFKGIRAICQPYTEVLVGCTAGSPVYLQGLMSRCSGPFKEVSRTNKFFGMTQGALADHFRQVARTPYPAYFKSVFLRNRHQYGPRPPVPLAKTFEEFNAAPGAVLIDTRSPDAFQLRHIAKAVNIPSAGIISDVETHWGIWFAAIVKDKPAKLVVPNGTAEEVFARASLVGCIDRITAVLEEDRLPSLPEDVIRPIEPSALNKKNKLFYDKALDVRTLPEHHSSRGRLHVSLNLPLHQLLEAGPAAEDELASCESVLMYCNDGFRSAIAASWVAASSEFNFKEVLWLQGGIAALTEACPASVDTTAINGRA
jgi:rhodanese-related sulfurtransferase/glyoxylase-like metal-dependent hydrolase (beta-lactamase superfamily II)